MLIQLCFTELGIEKGSVSGGYPAPFSTKQEFKMLKTKAADGRDISDELGEKSLAKQLAWNKYNNSAHHYQEVKSRARSAGAFTVNQTYAEVTLHTGKSASDKMGARNLRNPGRNP